MRFLLLRCRRLKSEALSWRICSDVTAPASVHRSQKRESIVSPLQRCRSLLHYAANGIFILLKYVGVPFCTSGSDPCQPPRWREPRGDQTAHGNAKPDINYIFLCIQTGSWRLIGSARDRRRSRNGSDRFRLFEARGRGIPMTTVVQE